MGDFFEQLSKVDFEDFCDEIAAISITDDRIIEMCKKYPCKVNLRRGNVVYAVEQKYKAKLATYPKEKILKWLKLKLPKIVPNPEAKYLKWKEKHKHNAKVEWLERKSIALGELPPPFDCSSDSEQSEESINEPHGSQSLLEKLRRMSQLSSCSTHVSNSTAGTVQTVIPSQPKCLDDNLSIHSNMAGLINCSHSDNVYSEELPTLLSKSVSCSCSEDIDVETVEAEATEHSKALPVGRKTQMPRTLLHESEEILSQTDQYAVFVSENIVSSTQEFGYD